MVYRVRVHQWKNPKFYFSFWIYVDANSRSFAYSLIESRLDRCFGDYYCIDKVKLGYLPCVFSEYQFPDVCSIPIVYTLPGGC